MKANGGNATRSEGNAQWRGRTDLPGNTYVEFEQQGRSGVWKDSGIRTTQADYWAVALPDGTVVLLPTLKVRALAEAAIDAGNWREMDRGDNPTRGALVPLWKLLEG